MVFGLTTAFDHSEPAQLGQVTHHKSRISSKPRVVSGLDPLPRFDFSSNHVLHEGRAERTSNKPGARDPTSGDRSMPGPAMGPHVTCSGRHPLEFHIGAARTASHSRCFLKKLPTPGRRRKHSESPVLSHPSDIR